ncbi:MAG: type II secretion system protein GspD [Planctomycetota bacterium]
MRTILLPTALLLLASSAVAQDAPKPAPKAPNQGTKELPPVPAPKKAPEKKEPALSIQPTERKIDEGNGWIVHYYPVNFVDPAVLQKELDVWKSKGATVAPMSTGAKASNVLRIRERYENLPVLLKMLDMLDQPQPQVLVKAKFVEISYDADLEWGFEATFDRGNADPTITSETFFRGGSGTFNPDSFLNSSNARPFQGSELNFAFVGDTLRRYGSFDYLLRLLKSKGKAEVLGEPNILATQGIPATLDAGEKVPIQTSTLSGSNVIVSTKFEETGIKLTITPELIGREAVRMKLEEQFSAVTGFLLGQGGLQNPIIDRRKASSTVTVRDGATLVVGGLHSTRKSEEESGIPLLMDIPVLGWFFKTHDESEVKTELYFFVTPEIIRGGYGSGVLTPPSEPGRLRDLNGTR